MNESPHQYLAALRRDAAENPGNPESKKMDDLEAWSAELHVGKDVLREMIKTFGTSARYPFRRPAALDELRHN